MSSAANTRLLIGPYRSGKTEKLLSELIEGAAAPGKPSALGTHLIVPSSRYRNLASERMSEKLRSGDSGQVKGLLGVKIDNFYTLCGQILKRSGVTYRLIPDSVRPAIVSRAMGILNERGELGNLAALAEFKGTYGSILELIDEFQRAGLSPDDVLSRLHESAADSSKHLELAKVYKQYWLELDNIDFLDNRRLAFSCREHLASRKETTRLFKFIGVDGFDRFSRLQLDVLQELSRFSEQMLICFDYLQDIEDSDERQEYIWKQSSYDDLVSSFSNAEIVWREPQVQELPPVDCVKAVDRFLEMEEIARSIKAAIVEDSVKPEDILLVVPNMRRYRSAIEAAFEDAGLPYFVDEAVSLKAVPVVQFIFKLLNLFDGDFSRAEVMTLLNSQHLNDEDFSLLKQAREKLDSLSLDNDLIGSRSQWMSLDLEESLKSELKRFFDILTPPQGSNTLTEFVSWVEDVVLACLKPPEDQDHHDQLKGWLEERAFAEFRQSLGGLVQEDIVLNGGKSGVVLTYLDFISHLEHIAEQSNFRSTSRYKKPVYICSVDLAPNRRFSRVYMGGLVEGEFPRRARAKGFTSFDEINLWSSYGIAIENPRLHPTFEYGLFQSLVKRAVQKVELSLPMWDMAGDEILPSFFITSGALPMKVEEVSPYKMSVLSPFSLKDFVSGATAFGAGSDRFKQYSNPEIVDLLDSIADQQAMLVARLEGIEGSNYNGCLTEPVALGTLEVRLPSMWSASRLNEYGKCPFRYWVSKVLNLEVYEEPTLELDARILGETYHKALELFYQKMIDGKIDSLNGDLEKSELLYRESVQEAIAWLESESRVVDNQFWQYLKKEIEFRLMRFFEYEIERENKAKEPFKASRVEAAFGMDDPGSAGPLVLGSGENQVFIRGKIDRVDVDCQPGGRRVKVIDYKAGSSYISSQEAFAGRNLQMPIYMMAARRCLDKDSEPVEGVYLSVSSGKPIGKIDFADSEKREEILKVTEKHVLNYVAAIGEGKFNVAPNGNTVCDSCGHKLICRISEMKSTTDSQ